MHSVGDEMFQSVLVNLWSSSGGGCAEPGMEVREVRGQEGKGGREKEVISFLRRKRVGSAMGF